RTDPGASMVTARLRKRLALGTWLAVKEETSMKRLVAVAILGFGSVALAGGAFDHALITRMEQQSMTCQKDVNDLNRGVDTIAKQFGMITKLMDSWRKRAGVLEGEKKAFENSMDMILKESSNIEARSKTLHQCTQDLENMSDKLAR